MIKIVFFLCSFGTLSCLNLSGKRLLCSSDEISMWYSYEGPIYYLSMNMSPCFQGGFSYTLTYTIIQMFTIARVGWHAVFLFNGQPWLEQTQPDVPCEDVKICYIIKGETLHDKVPVLLKPFKSLKGVYDIYTTIHIVDHLEKRVTIYLNVTIELKKDIV